MDDVIMWRLEYDTDKVPECVQSVDQKHRAGRVLRPIELGQYFATDTNTQSISISADQVQVVDVFSTNSIAISLNPQKNN